MTHTARVRPFDDDDSGGDSGSDSGGGSGGDSGSSDNGDGFGDGSSGGPTDSGDPGPGDTTSGDNGGEAGGSTSTTGSSDAGESAGSGGDSGSSPVDNTPTGGGSGGSNQDNGGGDDNTDDGGEDQILYPTGDPYDDSLYDDGGTTIVISPAPHAANFGGSLHVKLPDNPVIGDSGVATVDVFNTGGRATGTFELALGVSADGSAGSATRVAYETVPVRLGHDRVAVYKLPFTVPATLSPGTYRFLALIDAGNAFAESDESDNVAVGPSFTVAAAITDVGVTSATTRATVRPGQPAALAVHVKSMGTVAESGTTSVTVTATPVGGSSAPLQLMTVDRKVQLRRGQAATLKLKVPLPTLAAGQYQLTVTITPVSASDGNAADKSAVTNVMTVK